MDSIELNILFNTHISVNYEILVNDRTTTNNLKETFNL